MSSIGIFYGSNKGITENIAYYISTQFEAVGINVDVYNIATTAVSDINAYKRIVLGASTWRGAVFQEDWESMFMKLHGVDFSDKKIAFFGTGNQKQFPMTFIDAVGYLNNCAKRKGAHTVGQWLTDGYQFGTSLAIDNGKFAGLAIDEHNQAHKTFGRVKKWVNQIASQMTDAA